ncbi:MAG: conjugal transfer protein TraX [Oscillospiraceae bacterium]|nr:conjugal transfer protein TraX [Oscillospiraceae bacterium]
MSALHSRPSLNASQLKYLAAALMVVDHWNMLFQPLAGLYWDHPVLSNVFYFIGRTVFPIFAFFMAEGCRHTHNRKGYLIRLGVFGGVTELPFLLGLLSGSGSVIATFFLAAAGIFAFEALRERYPLLIALIPLSAFALLAQIAPTDYGFWGVITVAAVYFMGEDRRRQLAALALCMGAVYLLPTWGTLRFPSAVQWIAAGCACLSVLGLAACYNGERGKGSKWFFYWFYPLHLIVLGGLAMVL